MCSNLYLGGNSCGYFATKFVAAMSLFAASARCRSRPAGVKVRSSVLAAGPPRRIIVCAATRLPPASNEPGRRMCYFKYYARFGALAITAPTTQLRLLLAYQATPDASGSAMQPGVPASQFVSTRQCPPAAFNVAHAPAASSIDAKGPIVAR